MTQAQAPALIWDNVPVPADVHSVRTLLHATGVFHLEEIRMACHVVEDAIDEIGDFAFVFARTQRGKKLAGYACFGEIPLTDNRYDLYWIAVAPELRGLNIAAELLNRVEHRVRNSGGRIMYVEASGRDIYIPARRFYTKHGFTECANIPDFYKLGDPKIVYGKRLMAPGAARIKEAE